MTVDTVSGSVLSEFRKVTSLKVWWALGIPPVVIGFLASALYASIASSVGASEFGDIDQYVVLAGLVAAIGASALFAAVFGAVTAASEFRYATLTATFLTSPRRGTVVATKLLVAVVMGVGYAVAAILASIVSMALFGSEVFRIDGVVLSICVLGVLGTALWSVIGAGLGMLLGSPTWAAVALVVWLPVGELIVFAVLHGIGAGVLDAILPGYATSVMVSGRLFDSGADVLPWPAALLVVGVWALALAAGGWLRTVRKDVT